MRIISLHRASSLSGVSVLGARLAEATEQITPMIIGESVSEASIERTPLAPIERTLVCSWPSGASPMEQVECVRAALEKAAADAVLANDLPQGYLAAAVMPGVRCMGLFHGDHPRDHGFYESVLPLCDAWTGVSASIVRTLVSNASVPSVPPSPVLIAPMCVERTNPPPKLEAGAPLRLLYAGALDGNKRVLDLPRLCAALDAKAVTFEMVIAGDGPMRAVLEARLRPWLMCKSVRLLGSVPARDMAGWHRWSHVLVLVSETEGWPMVVQEAMAACRVAAVSTGCGGAAEAITHGVDGVVFETGDMQTLASELALMAEHPERIAQRAAKGRCLVERLASPARAAAALMQMMEALSPAVPAAERWPAWLRSLKLLGEVDAERAAEVWACAHGVDGRVLPREVPRLATPRERLMRSAVERLIAGGRGRIGIYGAGAHTRAMTRVLACDDLRGCIACIVDDEPRSAAMAGLPIVSPAEASKLTLDAVVLSSDGFEHLLAERARAWAGGAPIVGLYHHELRLEASCSQGVQQRSA